MGEALRRLNFYSHRIHIKVEGFRLERLLDQALKAGLDLKAVRMTEDNALTCWLSREDLKRLRHFAKSAYRITVLQQSGPVPQAKSILQRPAFVIGFVLALTFVIWQSFFVRSIEISGYRGIPEEALLRCLQENGIRKGACRPDIDWEAAEQAIYDTFPQVTWAKLAYKGQKVYLYLSETDRDLYQKEETADAPTQQVYTDLVASCSGYIQTIYPYSGLALVEEGDYVKKGQILITGKVPIEPTTYDEESEGGRIYFVNAKGEVWARVPYYVTLRQERYLWGEKTENGKIVADRAEKTEDQAKRRAEQQLRLWTAENLPENAEILKKSLKFTRNGNIIEVSVLLEVRQQIAAQQEEQIGETDTDTPDH
ncbi:MAG: sporulation protein YqfD [Firmicutes bacterium]|nr:sporulation protein YqfD [Bacillota bacterium]MDD7602427.1 sporulation protein YqfD [Bacillota bacterium]MDY5856142.1 sporulation protein YqfD [Anaerovoracaceae bacterium]